MKKLWVKLYCTYGLLRSTESAESSYLKVAIYIVCAILLLFRWFCWELVSRNGAGNLHNVGWLYVRWIVKKTRENVGNTDKIGTTIIVFCEQLCNLCNRNICHWFDTHFISISLDFMCDKNNRMSWKTRYNIIGLW